VRLTSIKFVPPDAIQKPHKIEQSQLQDLCRVLEAHLLEIAMMTSSADVVNSSHINLHDIRLGNEHIALHGYNESPHTGNRGRVLGWKDWVLVNNTVNDALDMYGISANVHTLHGKFKVRVGMTRFRESDWMHLAYENVGSYYSPMWRKDAWRSSGEAKCPKHPWYTGMMPARGGDDRECIFCGRIRAEQIAIKERAANAGATV